MDLNWLCAGIIPRPIVYPPTREPWPLIWAADTPSTFRGVGKNHLVAGGGRQSTRHLCGFAAGCEGSFIIEGDRLRD